MPASEGQSNVGFPAGLGRRLGAMLYDAMLISIGIWGSTLFVWVIAAGEAVTGWPVTVVLLAEMVLFYVYCWSRQGQTLGMAAWRIRVVSSDGQPATLKQIVVRIAAATLSFASLGIGYLWLYVGDAKQTWHDRLSDTTVVHIPKTA